MCFIVLYYLIKLLLHNNLSNFNISHIYDFSCTTHSIKHFIIIIINGHSSIKYS